MSTKRENEIGAGLSPLPKKGKGDEGAIDVEDELDETHGLAPPPPPPLIPDDDGARQLPNAAQVPTQQKVTLEAIGELLDQKLTPMNTALAKLSGDLEMFKSKVRDQLKDMGLKIENMENMTLGNTSKITQLEEEFERLKLRTCSLATESQKNNADEKLTVVIGNIPNADSLETAQQWLCEHLTKWGLPQTNEAYIKTMDFKGLLFIKCLSTTHRDQLIMRVRNLPSSATPKTFAKTEQPFNIRTAESMLFSIKHMLVEWKFGKGCVKVGTDTLSLSVGGLQVVKVAVTDFALKIEWCDGEWEQWELLQKSEELKSIKDKTEERLKRAKEFASAQGSTKGKGKSSS
jgi:hypothetical protein